MSLRAVHAFGRVFDVEVTRSGRDIRVRVVPDRGAAMDQIAPRDRTLTIVF